MSLLTLLVAVHHVVARRLAVLIVRLGRVAGNVGTERHRRLDLARRTRPQTTALLGGVAAHVGVVDMERGVVVLVALAVDAAAFVGGNVIGDVARPQFHAVRVRIDASAHSRTVLGDDAAVHDERRTQLCRRRGMLQTAVDNADATALHTLVAGDGAVVHGEGGHILNVHRGAALERARRACGRVARDLAAVHGEGCLLVLGRSAPQVDRGATMALVARNGAARHLEGRRPIEHDASTRGVTVIRQAVVILDGTGLHLNARPVLHEYGARVGGAVHQRVFADGGAIKQKGGLGARDLHRATKRVVTHPKARDRHAVAQLELAGRGDCRGGRRAVATVERERGAILRFEGERGALCHADERTVQRAIFLADNPPVAALGGDGDLLASGHGHGLGWAHVLGDIDGIAVLGGVDRLLQRERVGIIGDGVVRVWDGGKRVDLLRRGGQRAVGHHNVILTVVEGDLGHTARGENARIDLLQAGADGELRGVGPPE